MFSHKGVDLQLQKKNNMKQMMRKKLYYQNMALWLLSSLFDLYTRYKSWDMDEDLSQLKDSNISQKADMLLEYQHNSKEQLLSHRYIVYKSFYMHL